MKILQRAVLSLLIVCMAVSGSNGKGVQKVSAATQAGYYTVERSYPEYDNGRVTYTKVRGTNFAVLDHQIRVKSGSKVKTIVKSSNYITRVITNGTKIFYQITNKVYSVSKNGKNKKTVCTWKNNYSLSGVYNGCLYYDCRYGELDSDSATYRYTIKTKKSVKLFDNQGISKQRGTIMLVSGLANDVSPVSLKIYDLKTKKATLLCKQQIGNQFIGSKLYYAKLIKYDYDAGDTYHILYYSLNTKKITTVCTIKGMNYISEFTAKGCYFLDRNSEKCFYNYKTGAVSRAS